MLEQRLLDFIKKNKLLKKKDKILLGTSGGPDSVFLFHQFLKIRQDYKLQLVCLHFNHLLRKEAKKEEKFIEALCKKYSVRFISERKDVDKFFKGDSLEQTARNLRFDFFLKSSRETKIKKIALAHHKDDLVETVLMRLIRGSGLRGLRGFLPCSKFRSLTVIRPLIEFRKKEILSWLKKQNISYCIDKTNFEDKFLRNKLRLKIIPSLKQINPNIDDSLYNLAHNIALDYDFIYSFSYEKFLDLKKREQPRSISLDLEGVKGLSAAIFNNVLRIAIEQVKGNTRKLDTRHLEEIKDLVSNRPLGSVVDLPELKVKKQQNLLSIQSLIL